MLPGGDDDPMRPSAFGAPVRSTARAALTAARSVLGAAVGHPAEPWTAADMPNQSGRTALVTGANSGLGLQASLALGRAGARVLMTARDPRKGELARARVAAVATGPAPELVLLDLADLPSVRHAAEDVAARAGSLDLLIANAGVMMTPKRRTEQGFELQLATNHLGHFALLGRVLPLLLASGQTDPTPAGPTPTGSVTPTGAFPRVVVVSSVAARAGRVMLADLQYDRRAYHPFGAYAQSKLANLLFARELQQRADAAGRRLLVAAAHPGLSHTGLYPNSVLGSSAVLAKATGAVVGALGQDDVAGVLPLLYAATMPGVRPGEYLGPSGIAGFTGAPTPVSSPPAASDDATAAALWLASEDLTDVDYVWT